MIIRIIGVMKKLWNFCIDYVQLIFELLKIYLFVFCNFSVEKSLYLIIGIIKVVKKLWNFGIDYVQLIFEILKIYLVVFGNFIVEK